MLKRQLLQDGSTIIDCFADIIFTVTVLLASSIMLPSYTYKTSAKTSSMGSEWFRFKFLYLIHLNSPISLIPCLSYFSFVSLFSMTSCTFAVVSSSWWNVSRGENLTGCRSTSTSVLRTHHFPLCYPLRGFVPFLPQQHFFLMEDLVVSSKTVKWWYPQPPNLKPKSTTSGRFDY